MRTQRVILAVWLLATVPACGSAGAGTADAGGDTYVGCVNDPRVNLTAFPGTVAADAPATVQLALLTADPPVPLAGENTWTFALRNADGSAVTEPAGTVITADAFMPDHGHPSSLVPSVTLQPDGTWRLERVYLTMAGVWRITLKIAQPTATQTAVIYVCVAG